MKLALLALLALTGTACGSSAPRANAPSGGGVVEIPTAKAEPKAKTDDTPAPSSNAEAYAGGEDGVEVDEGYDYAEPPPPVPAPIWGSAASGPSGGPDCDRAADCCLKVVTVNGGDPNLAQTCDSFRTAPATTCASLLRSFSQVAPQIGIVCP